MGIEEKVDTSEEEMYQGLMDEDDHGDDPEESSEGEPDAAEALEPTESAKPKEEEPAEAAQEPPKKPEPSAVAPQEPPKDPGQAATQQQPSGGSAEEQAKQVETNRKALLNHLEAQVYKLSDDEAADLVINAAEAMPKFAAKIHMSVLEMVHQMMGNVLPQAMQQQIAATQAETAAKEKFFGRWPKLREHQQAVERNIGFYRQANPQADFDTLVEEVGAFTSMQLRIPPETPAPPQAPKAPPPPPGGGSAPAAGARPPSDNPYTQMANTWFDEDDWGQ